MKKAYKLKSYTVIELVISMLVMSVVVIITYSFLSSLSLQLGKFIKTQEVLLDYTFFKSTLKREFFEADKLNIKKNEIELISKENTVSYNIM
ncbi:hypothetical protein, partial [Tenacibaculum maritimum]|uniref:hypothetical protein n=1 Tax=Tenacibaculum maritimum TaxID=107401 RepID=UPI003876F07B